MKDINKITDVNYTYCHYKKFDYSILRLIKSRYRPGRTQNQYSFNDVIIMIDTETSKKVPDRLVYEKGVPVIKTGENHVVVWTISIRAEHHNICTLYGRKPSKLIETMERIHSWMSGQKTHIYIHNMGYDYTFLRRFMFRSWGEPIHQLNVKPHVPIYMEFSNGIMLHDSLILAQRKLEKWANDLNVKHKKAVGCWNYDKIRNQNTPLNHDEFTYIECDTLAGVECLDATLQALGKNIDSIPMTATGITREKTRKKGKHKAHEQFLKMALTLAQYHKFTLIYHGGFTHGNRHYINFKIDGTNLLKGGKYVKCGDFASSYPFTMLAFKFPMEKFTPIDNCDMSFILDSMDDYAFAFKFIAVNIQLKDDGIPMPALQESKAVKLINPIVDNGRILAANYIEIYLSEYDLAVIAEQYNMEKHICVDVEMAAKDYLPRWFTDFIFECFTEKTMLKGGDPVAYSLAKATVNSLYGMCVQHSIQDNIVEDYKTGEYIKEPPEDEEELYRKYLEKVSTILPYQWGVWVTSIAFYNLHQMLKCCDLPLYSDTDSCYGIDWNNDKLKAYNDHCKELLQANGYGPVVRDGREYWLGIIESDGLNDCYTEFKYMGAKRYCGRNAADGKIHITVAGVPKKGAECLNDNIDNFEPSFIFSGKTTGKKTHCYFYMDDIYIDKNGNETGDSISLIPCDYKLDAVDVVDWESLFNEDVEVQVYDEY